MPSLDALLTTADVVVPTLRRGSALRRCLDGLAAQRFAPRRVVVVAQPDDADTWELLATRGDVVPVVVDRPGVVAALRAGVAETASEVVAFIDDDAVPPADWLERLVTALRAPGVGGIGGRDVIDAAAPPTARDVGRLTWWGRLSGAHHRGRGAPRDVDVLKGVCMAFRADALALPDARALRGNGAQPHHELLTCAWALARGWRLVYDPSITVAHHSDGTNGSRHQGFTVAYNRTRGAFALAPERRAATLAYGVLMGAREAPGLGRAVLAALELDGAVVADLGASLVAQVRAARDQHVEGEVAMTSCHELRSRPAR